MNSSNDCTSNSPSEGLEISIFTLSEVKKNRNVRLDAQFFAPSFRSTMKRLIDVSERTIRDVCEVRREKFDPNRDGDFDYIQIGDIDKTCVAGSNPVSVDEAPSRAKWFVRSGDVITSTVRPIRRLSAQIVPEQDGFVCSSGFTVLRPTEVPPEMLLTWLRMPVICKVMDRFTNASMYPAIAEDDILDLPFPVLESSTEQEIVSLVSESRDAVVRANELSNAASNDLVNTLGLPGRIPAEPLDHIANANDIEAVGRMDARFFAPEFRSIFERLSDMSDQMVDSVCEIRREKFDASEHDEIDYIEIGNLGESGISGSERIPADTAPSRATQFVRPGDVITSTVSPIHRLSAQIMPDQDGFVCSSGFVVLKPIDVEPELFLTWLRLPIICETMDRFVTGSIFPAITASHILKLPFPRVDENTKQNIVSTVRKSHDSLRKAQCLLDAAGEVFRSTIGM